MAGFRNETQPLNQTEEESVFGEYQHATLILLNRFFFFFLIELLTGTFVTLISRFLNMWVTLLHHIEPVKILL